jgi:predicted aldo/keto reductase-like oxidoreductase
MPEAYALVNQAPANQDSRKQKQSLLSTAAKLGIAVIVSATLQHGQLTHGLPDFVNSILGLNSDAENAIQFSRSAPGMTTSLVGMGHKERVAANLKPALVPPTPIEEWNKLFTRR